jgi:DHA2 family methylenomycin A resistance protein-like MFS transporter
VAAAAFAAFVVAQTRVAHPMVPPSLLRSRAVATSLAVGFAVNAGVYGMLFLFSLYFQQARGMSTMATGLAFLPMTALTAVMSPVAGRVIARVGVLPPLVIGTLLPAAGLAALAAAVSGGSTALLIALTVPIGAGGPLAVTAITTLMLDSVPAAYAGTASGVLNACRQLGGALAVAVFGALLSGPSGVLHGVRLSLAICVLLLAGSAVISLLLRGRTAAPV